MRDEMRTRSCAPGSCSARTRRGPVLAACFALPLHKAHKGGVHATRAARREPSRGREELALAGLILGLVAIPLNILWIYLLATM